MSCVRARHPISGQQAQRRFHPAGLHLLPGERQRLHPSGIDDGSGHNHRLSIHSLASYFEQCGNPPTGEPAVPFSALVAGMAIAVIRTDPNEERNSCSLSLPRGSPSAAQHIPAIALFVGIRPVLRRLYWLPNPQDCRGPSRRRARKLLSDDMFHHPFEEGLHADIWNPLFEDRFDSPGFGKLCIFRFEQFN